MKIWSLAICTLQCFVGASTPSLNLGNASEIYQAHHLTIQLFSQHARLYHELQPRIDRCYQELRDYCILFANSHDIDYETADRMRLERMEIERKCNRLEQGRRDMLHEISQILSKKAVLIYEYYELIGVSVTNKLRRAIRHGQWARTATLYDALDMIERDKQLIVRVFIESREDRLWSSSVGKPSTRRTSSEFK